MSLHVFYYDDAIKINEARLNHLASLGLSLRNKRVLEVGAGVGLLTGFFESRGCDVTSTEGRTELISENLSKNPRRKGKVFCVDLMTKGSHDHLVSMGPFDIVFCYGTLYHLADPGQAILDLSAVCKGVMLIETIVWHVDDGDVRAVGESASLNQSLHGQGSRPARDWVLGELKKRFEHVYISTTQPRHPQFPTSWPAPEKAVNRAVFVASRTRINLPSLTEKLPMEQRRI